ncbi:MAG: DUF6340 family protein [Paludibacter sp.]|nr:DUF6340 family protein [Paludibacter sp.]
MKYCYRYTLLFFLSVLLASCSGMLYTSIDILRPAKVSFPVDVNHMLIINNSLSQPHQYGHKTDLFNESQKNILVDTDSIAIFALASFAESIIQKEFFGSVNLVHNSINRGNDFFAVSLPDKSSISYLVNQNQANGVISLNRILVNDNQGELYNQEENTFIAYLEAKYEMQWSIHFPEKNKIFTLITNDTVYWESESYSRQRALSGLPDRKDALIDGALISGERAVKNFIPYWEQADRYLFNGSNKSFKAGMDSVYVRNWVGATQVWDALLNKLNNPYQKGKVAHNLSVVSEINGNIQKAYDYATIALDSFINSTLVEYRNFMFVVEQHETLKQRLNDLEVLNKQLGE